MKPLSIAETKEIQGGALSGAFLTGVAGLIDGLNTLITNIGGMTFAFNNQNRIKGAVQFNKTFNFSWDDTKAPQATIMSTKWTNATPNKNVSSNSIWNFQ